MVSFHVYIVSESKDFADEFVDEMGIVMNFNVVRYTEISTLRYSDAVDCEFNRLVFLDERDAKELIHPIEFGDDELHEAIFSREMENRENISIHRYYVKETSWIEKNCKTNFSHFLWNEEGELEKENDCDLPFQ